MIVRPSMIVIVLVLVLILHNHNTITSTFALRAKELRKTTLFSGDVVIGALVSVHHQPKADGATSLICGSVSTSLKPVI